MRERERIEEKIDRQSGRTGGYEDRRWRWTGIEALWEEGDDETKKKTRHSKKNERVAVGRRMDDGERERSRDNAFCW